MIYLPSAMNPPRNEKGEQMDLQRGSTTHIFIAVGVFYYILYRMALLWVVYIDPLCAKAVNTSLRWAYGEPLRHNGSLEKPVLLS
jgi:hypothetical protein